MLWAEKQFCLEFYWPVQFRKPWKDRHLFCSHSNGMSRRFMKPQLPSTLAKEQYLCGLFTKRGSHAQKHCWSELFYCHFVVPLEIQDLLPSWTFISSEPDQKGPKVRWKIRNTVSGKGNEKEERNWTEKGWMFTSSEDYFKVLMCSFYYQTVVIC